MAWFELILAGILEVFWSTMMKWSDGFSKLNYSFYTVIGMIASFYSLIKGDQTVTNEFILSYLDRNRCRWFSDHWCRLVS